MILYVLMNPLYDMNKILSYLSPTWLAGIGATQAEPEDPTYTQALADIRGTLRSSDPHIIPTS